MFDRLRAALGYQMPRLGPLAFRLFERFGPQEIDTELFSGIHALLDLRDQTQRASWWQGERFEAETCLRFRAWIPGAPLFFDIGSNYGFFSLLALTIDPAVRVHAFEPHPQTFARLDAIRNRNRLDRLSCWNQGIGDREERLSLHPGHADLGHSTFGAHPLLPADPAIFVPVEPFDSWRRRSGIALPERPCWIAKIDVEGFELKVLKGMAETLEARAFAGLAVEINPYSLAFCETAPDDIFGLLRKNGYVAENAPPPGSPEPFNVFFVPRDA